MTHEELERMDISARLTDAREEYRDMAQGHPGLSGWCAAMANRVGRQVERLLCPPAQGQEGKAQGQEGQELAQEVRP